MVTSLFQYCHAESRRLIVTEGKECNACERCRYVYAPVCGSKNLAERSTNVTMPVGVIRSETVETPLDRHSLSGTSWVR